MNLLPALEQLLEVLVALALSPLLLGWVNQCRAWLQNRHAPSLLQPYRGLSKLFHKQVVLAHGASSLFRGAPYVVFGCMLAAAAMIPSLGTRLPFTAAADAIVLVGLFAAARMFMALAAMDVGTAFGSLGARREMMVGFLAEPALLMVVFVASLMTATTALPLISERLATQAFAIYPSLMFTAVAFVMVLLAENARIPVDNPATHLELTMIHEAMLLEYSGRHLALMEWASALKLYNYACIGLALFVPWGLATSLQPQSLLLALLLLLAKLLVVGTGLALIETVSAKLRVFRAPEFLATAFLLAVLGLLVHVLNSASGSQPNVRVSAYRSDPHVQIGTLGRIQDVQVAKADTESTEGRERTQEIGNGASNCLPVSSSCLLSPPGQLWFSHALMPADRSQPDVQFGTMRRIQYAPQVIT